MSISVSAIALAQAFKQLNEAQDHLLDPSLGEVVPSSSEAMSSLMTGLDRVSEVQRSLQLALRSEWSIAVENEPDESWGDVLYQADLIELWKVVVEAGPSHPWAKVLASHEHAWLVMNTFMHAPLPHARAWIDILPAVPEPYALLISLYGMRHAVRSLSQDPPAMWGAIEHHEWAGLLFSKTPPLWAHAPLGPLEHLKEEDLCNALHRLSQFGGNFWEVFGAVSDPLNNISKARAQIKERLQSLSSSPRSMGRGWMYHKSLDTSNSFSWLGSKGLMCFDTLEEVQVHKGGGFLLRQQMSLGQSSEWGKDKPSRPVKKI